MYQGYRYENTKTAVDTASNEFVSLPEKAIQIESYLNGGKRDYREPKQHRRWNVYSE